MVVVGKLAEGKVLDPIILKVGDAGTEVILDGLIDAFGLAVGLWVIRSGRKRFDAESLEEGREDSIDKGGPAIGDDSARGAMKSVNLANEERSKFVARHRLATGNEVGGFDMSADHNPNGVEALRDGKLDNEVP